MKKLDVERLKIDARDFARKLSATAIQDLYGVTDGKAVGTYVEQAFHQYLQKRHAYAPGNVAHGIDIPELKVDIKVTSIQQPQSSCPFNSAREKVYGLGYDLIVFVYEKKDERRAGVARLNIKHTLFIRANRTGDYQTTSGLSEIMRRKGNKDDVIAFLEERNLPLDEIGRKALAEEILKRLPKLGYLTISNALQWRLQYGRAISLAEGNSAEGIENLLPKRIR